MMGHVSAKQSRIYLFAYASCDSTHALDFRIVVTMTNFAILVGFVRCQRPRSCDTRVLVCHRPWSAT
jgi:hypothetical protein